MTMKHFLFLLLGITACFQAHAGNDANNTNYIQEWGRLQLNPYEVDLGQHQRTSWGGEPDYMSKQLCDQEGFPIQLKGFSAFGQDHGNCLKSKEDLVNLREMGVNCIRIARLISGEGKISDEQVKQWMAWTNETGLYCIVDWHFMNELNEKNEDSGDPNDYIEEASAFFRMVAQEVADKQYKHILYEVCNEPSGVEWETIKNYAETIIDIITSIDTNKPIIIVGTPDWCQKTYQVASSQNLIETDKAGIMYSFHYFAGEAAHQNLMFSELDAATMAIPIIVTEWNLGKVQESGETEGDNSISTEQGAKFLQKCAVNNTGKQLVSWIYNSYGYGGNGAAMFKDECGGELSTSGRFISEHISTINYKDGPRQNYYVKDWGRLNIVWSQLSDENGNPIQLKGFTAFSPGYENCLNTKEDLDNLRETGVNCVRIARHISGEGKISDEQVKQWMEWAYEAGLYCIIDWHFMSELNEKNESSGDPNDYIEEASEFFQMVAQEVADKQYKHILYEICNEPSGVDWETIKSYAKAIANIITDIDTTRPIIIVGTPNWCQRIHSQVDATDNNVISGKAGIMYAFHFYAGETAHMALESSEFLPATKRVPVIVTEWNAGNLPDPDNGSESTLNTQSAQTFLNHCQGTDGSSKTISWIYNSYGYGGDGGSIFKENCGGDLTTTGKFICNVFGGCYEETDITAIQGEPTIVYPTIVEKGRFTVSVPDKANVLIYNVTGSLVQSEEINGSSEISTRLAPGLYNVKVIQEEEAQTTKIIVK